MKNPFTTIFFSLCLSNCFAQANQTDSAAKANELIGIEQKLMDGVATGDTELWKQYLSPQFMIVNEDGSRTGYRAFVNDLRPLPKGSSGHINVTKPHFHFIGNVAVFNYVADEYETVQGQQLHTSYATMEIYQKERDKWQLMNSQVFEVPQLPLPIEVKDDVLKQYTGTYHFTDDTSCDITLEDHHLYIKKKGRDREELLPETPSVFFRMSDTRGRRIFLRAADGKWQMLERRNGQDLVWKQ